MNVTGKSDGCKFACVCNSMLGLMNAVHQTHPKHVSRVHTGRQSPFAHQNMS